MTFTFEICVGTWLSISKSFSPESEAACAENVGYKISMDMFLFHSYVCFFCFFYPKWYSAWHSSCSRLESLACFDLFWQTGTFIFADCRLRISIIDLLSLGPGPTYRDLHISLKV